MYFLKCIFYHEDGAQILEQIPKEVVASPILADA